METTIELVVDRERVKGNSSRTKAWETPHEHHMNKEVLMKGCSLCSIIGVCQLDMTKTIPNSMLPMHP